MKGFFGIRGHFLLSFFGISSFVPLAAAFDAEQAAPPLKKTREIDSLARQT